MTEPYTYENRVAGLPSGIRTVYHRNKNIRPRACIVASKDVNLTAMENWCNEDCAVALTRVGGKQTVIISLYLDIQKEVQPGWLDDLMQMIEEKNFPVILGVDSNAHSSLYGTDTNARGNAFEDFILQYGLKIENIGEAPTFETLRGNKMIRTHIDVTLTRGLAAEVQDWRVNTAYNASDHNTIQFVIASKKPEPELIRPWSKADWNLFRMELSTADYALPKDMSMKKLDKLVKKTYDNLDKALNKACPKISVTSVGKSHWATDKHERAKDKVSALYKEAKKSGDCSK